MPILKKTKNWNISRSTRSNGTYNKYCHGNIEFGARPYHVVP